MDRHVSADALAAQALGEPIGPEQARHVAGCAACEEQLAEFTAVVTRARGLAPELRAPQATPWHLWDGITAELADDTREAPPSPPGPRSVHAATGQPHVEATGRAPAADDGVADLPRARGRRRRTVIAGLAAAAITIAAVGVPVLLPRAGAPEQAPPIASTSLTPLDDRADPAVATLTDEDGTLTLTVERLDLPAVDGYYELWLLDSEARGMVSLGPVTGPTEVPLPSGLNLAAFPIIDVSVEPFDGDPTHSGDSVLRGELVAISSSVSRDVRLAAAGSDD